MNDKYYVKWIYLVNNDADVYEREFNGFEEFSSFLMHNNQVMNILEMGINDKIIKYNDTL